jgi:hypothetical protein
VVQTSTGSFLEDAGHVREAPCRESKKKGAFISNLLAIYLIQLQTNQRIQYSEQVLQASWL